MEEIPNILASRYASQEMRNIWSASGRILLERDLWIAVLKGQRDLGLDVPQEAIDAYERVRDSVNVEAIRKREEVTRHDVKARIEEFCELAGHEHIHKGMTSRDLTENVEQLQVFRSLDIVLKKSVAALARFSEKAKRYRDVMMVARTHNVAAQPTTLGKRFAMFGEELLYATEKLETIIGKYPARGLKGAVGTQVDQLTLFDGDAEKVALLERKVMSYLNIWCSFKRTGQVYPRSLDLEVVEALVQVASGPASFALTLRLMSGQELGSEGFAPGQTGSSAMPHKINARSCERITGFKTILNGYLAMAADLAGGQWNEGDVSCSVVRRVMLPDTFFAIDGLLETLITVLDQMEIYESVIELEARRYLPFLATTTILMAAVKGGAGRESAHEAIKEHAVAVSKDLRSGAIKENDLLDRLAADTRLGLTADRLQDIMTHQERLVGMAPEQVDNFVEEVKSLSDRHPGAAAYKPEGIL